MNGTANFIVSESVNPIFTRSPAVCRQRPVLPALRQYFDAAWIYTVPVGASGKSATVPEGCADVYWSDGTLRVAGPHTQVKVEQVVAGRTGVGLRFRPEGALSWLRTPISDITDSRVELESLWGTEARRLIAWVGESRTPGEIANRIEHAFLRRLSGVGRPDAFHSAVIRHLRARHDYSIPIAYQLGRTFEMSERTLRRRCQEAFGYGVKTLDRIFRFQRFIALARLPGNDQLVELAGEAGFADQAHLAREARELAGLTPKQIRTQSRY